MTPPRKPRPPAKTSQAVVAALTVLGTLGAAQVHSAPPKSGKAQHPQALVGGYGDEGVDSGMRQYLLPGGDYCFVLMAGALDLMLAGTWSAQPGPKGDWRVRIDARALAPAPYVAWTRPPASSDSGQPNAPALYVSGQRFSMANDMHPVTLGFGQTPDQPSELAYLFAPGQSQFERHYRLPIPPEAQHVFVGHQTPEGWALTAFAVPERSSFSLLSLSFDFNAAYAGKADAVWRKGLLQITSGPLQGAQGLQQPVSPAEAQDVLRHCVQPVRQGDASRIFPSGVTVLEGRAVRSAQAITRAPWLAPESAPKAPPPALPTASAPAASPAEPPASAQQP